MFRDYSWFRVSLDVTMKSSVLFLLALTFVGGIRAEIEKLPHVTVNGTAITEAKPDILRWTLTVTNTDAAIGMVADTHTQYAAAVLRFLGDRGIRPEDMQTSGMRFSENREFREHTWVKNGYIATTMISFTMKDVSGYREAWLGLAGLKGVAVERVDWDVSNRIALQNSSRIEAVKKAKAKAEELTAALGAHVAEPLSIEEIVENPWVQSTTNSISVSAAASGDAGEALAPGTVPIRTRVSVSFRIVTP